MKAVLLIIGFAGAAIAVLNPLQAKGDALWGPGYGDMLNGGVAFGLMLLAGGIAVVMLAAKRRAEAGTR